jgi:hypothetical protein
MLNKLDPHEIKHREPRNTHKLFLSRKKSSPNIIPSEIQYKKKLILFLHTAFSAVCQQYRSHWP